MFENEKILLDGHSKIRQGMKFRREFFNQGCHFSSVIPSLFDVVFQCGCNSFLLLIGKPGDAHRADICRSTFMMSAYA